jgi:hypothetical protein
MAGTTFSSLVTVPCLSFSSAFSMARNSLISFFAAESDAGPLL